MINIPLPKQLPVRNINPKKLGFVCPNGQINFQTEEAAFEYTKNSIINALKVGKEREIFTKGSSVLKIIDGNEKEVVCAFDDLPQIAGCTLHHGHPPAEYGYCTRPFSGDDVSNFILLNKIFGYEKSVVYNYAGEECTMTMKRRTLLNRLNLPISKKLTLYRLSPKIRYQQRLIPRYEINFAYKYDAKYFLKHLKSRCNEEENTFIKQCQEENNTQKFMDWLLDKGSSLMRHDTLKAITQKLGIEYKTTFSNLKD